MSGRSSFCHAIGEIPTLTLMVSFFLLWLLGAARLPKWRKEKGPEGCPFRSIQNVGGQAVFAACVSCIACEARQNRAPSSQSMRCEHAALSKRLNTQSMGRNATGCKPFLQAGRNSVQVNSTACPVARDCCAASPIFTAHDPSFRSTAGKANSPRTSRRNC